MRTGKEKVASSSRTHPPPPPPSFFHLPRPLLPPVPCDTLRRRHCPVTEVRRGRAEKYGGGDTGRRRRAAAVWGLTQHEEEEEEIG